VNTPDSPNRRILVVDDNRTIHQDFRKILCPPSMNDSLDEMEADIFGQSEDETVARLPGFELSSAFQGEEAVHLVRSARQQGTPYAVAFVDIRMPPGIDGVETTSRLWREDPDIQVVICSAYADYSWEEMMQKLGLSQRLLILRKPFDGIEVRQLAYALTEKWELLRRSQLHLEELARAVEERSRQLTLANARLIQSQRLEALGRLSAGLAHEINNPLSFILANLGYLRSTLEAAEPSHLSDKDLQELREVCAESLEGAERIRRIIQSIRLFSRLDEAPRTRVNVHEVLEHALDEVRPLLRPEAQLVRDFQSVPPVYASEHGLQQVFFGLLANAAQALKEGPNPPRLRVATTLQEDGRVAVEIQDNGKGIAPEHLSRVFEPFFTTKRLGTTTGLGLSVCYGLIIGLGGDITADSALGQGATFRVLLPQAPAERLTPAPVRGS
jgi:two-component system, NtrC family, sensor kinase